MHLEEHKHKEGVLEVIICLIAALAGSLAYITLNRWVESMAGEEGGEAGHDEESRVITKGIEHAEPHNPLKDVEAVGARNTPPQSSRAKSKWTKIKTAVKVQKMHLMARKGLRMK